MRARSRQGQGLCKARGEEDSGQAFPAQAAAQGSSGVGRCAWGSCDPPPPPLTSCGTTASFTLSLSFPVCKPAFPGGGGGRVHPSAGRELGWSLVLKEPCLPAPASARPLMVSRWESAGRATLVLRERLGEPSTGTRGGADAQRGSMAAKGPAWGEARPSCNPELWL